jgi:hypothetical protein
VTSGEFDVTGFALSHSGKKLVYAARTNELKPFIQDIFVKGLPSGRTVKITRGNMGLESLAWSPDDGSIAFSGSSFPRGFASHDRLWVVGADGKSRPRKVDNTDRNKANTLNSDVRSGGHGPAATVRQASSGRGPGSTTSSRTGGAPTSTVPTSRGRLRRFWEERGASRGST